MWRRRGNVLYRREKGIVFCSVERAYSYGLQAYLRGWGLSSFFSHQFSWLAFLSSHLVKARKERFEHVYLEVQIFLKTFLYRLPFPLNRGVMLGYEASFPTVRAHTLSLICQARRELATIRWKEKG